MTKRRYFARYRNYEAFIFLTASWHCFAVTNWQFENLALHLQRQVENLALYLQRQIENLALHLQRQVENLALELQ